MSGTVVRISVAPVKSLGLVSAAGGVIAVVGALVGAGV